MSDEIEKLAERFLRFPGIGPRQARRFVQFLLMQPQGYNDELAESIKRLRSSVSSCERCRRFFTPSRDERICRVCSNANRDASLLLVVEKDSDLDSIERAASYDGYYFVLGGTIPILEKEPRKRVRLDELKRLVKERAKSGLEEIILAFSVNPEGEHTAELVEAELKSELPAGVRISRPGRGLSTGLELEYSDSETLRNALQNRS